MPVDLVPQLVGASIRACGLGLIALVALPLFRVRSSSAQHAAWTVVLIGMLLQLPFGLVAPNVPVKALPALPAPAQPLVQPGMMASERISVPPDSTRTQPKAGSVSPGGTLSVVYLAISMLLFMRMALGSLGLRRILRDASPIPNLGSRVFESGAFAVPGSVGCFRAKIILPVAWKDWDAVTLRSVLAHEKAHIRRWDWLIRVASHANVCIFWFHPLGWWMERELARLAEEACDDIAVSEIEDRQDYAAALVDIAHAAADGVILNWRLISMARESNVARRVNRILEGRPQAAKPFGRLAWVALLACSLPVIYLSAAVKLARFATPTPGPIVMERAAVPSVPPQLIAQAAPDQRFGPAPSQPVAPPITMCILIDNSGSMRGEGPAVKAAALAFVKASRPNDQVCIVNFNDEVFSGLPHGEVFTSDVTEMQEALAHIDARGGKAMRDAVRMSIDQVQHTTHNNRKVLVLITEGNDSASTVTQEQLLDEIGKSGVRVYCIGLVSEDDPSRAEAAERALGQLANASGGRPYYPKDLAEVESMSPEIANEIRKQ